MASFAALDDLNISAHGDSREKDLWPTVATTLSHYQSFWRTLIVLLSNRIEPNVRFGDPEWIQARSMIPCAYERLAMHNYSLFYFTARVRQAIDEDSQRLALGNYPHPEIVFFLLHASVKHAEKLQSIARDILRDLGMRPKFPKRGPFRAETIRLYRDAFTHDPVLGRRIGHDQELLPPETRLGKRKGEFLLWRDTALISTSDMIDEVKLEDRLWHDLSAFLQKQWEYLTQAFLQARQCEKFLADLGLTPLLPIHCTPNAFSHAGSMAPSRALPAGSNAPPPKTPDQTEGSQAGPNRLTISLQ